MTPAIPGARPRRRFSGRVLAAVLLALSLSVTTVAATGCSSKSKSSTSASPSPSTSEQKVAFAKTKFVLHAGLAAGAFHRWLYKPYRAGTFKSGAKGRTTALIKGALAGAFTVHEVRQAIDAANGDPALSKLVAPLSAAVDKVKDLGSKVRGGNVADNDMAGTNSIIDGLKNAGSQNGLAVNDQIPSLSQLNSG